MKKLLLFLTIFSFAMTLWAQTIEEDFNDGWPDGWTTIDLGDNEGTWSYSDQYGIDNSGCIDLDTWDGDLPNDGQADDWLIAPQVTLEEGTVLSFYAICSESYPDEISVMVSKGSAAIEDFTIAVEENMQLTGEYVKYEYVLTDMEDLAEGDEVYVAIHCNSNGSWVDVDNFYLGPDMATLFETFDDGFPEGWTTVDNGENEGTWDTIAEGGLEGSSCVWVDCYDPGPANDWLITPQVTLAEGDFLSFWAYMGYQEFHDTLYVRISKETSAVEDFTIEVADIITSTEGFVKFNYDLAEIGEIAAGDAVYIGLHADSWGSQISVDNFRVGAYVPPVFNLAYSYSNTELIAEYDIDVTEGDINLGEIVLHSNGDMISFSSFTIDEDNPKKVHFSGASEEIVADNVVDMLENTSLGDEVELYAGVLPLTYASITNPEGTLIFDGPLATFKGIVTYINQTQGRVWITDQEGAHHAVNTYQSGTALAEAASIGDEVLIYGSVSPFENQTEIYPANYLATLSEGNAMFPATAISGADIDMGTEADTDPAEQYESTLVKVDSAMVEEIVTELVLDNGDTITAALCNDGNGSFYVGDNLGIFNGTFDESTMTVGNEYTVTGILVNKGGKYVIAPRYEADMSMLTGIPEMDRHDDVAVYPNPASDFLHLKSEKEINRMVVFDVTGNQVRDVSLTQQSNIDIHYLNAGVYFIRFYQDKQWVQTSRIVKQ